MRIVTIGVRVNQGEHTMETFPGRTLLCLLALLNGSCLAAAQSEQRDSWKHSCYVYRDVDRNGVFDMGDRPYGNLWIEMTRPDGSRTGVHSNFDGFANFNVAEGDTDAEVHEPGNYRIRAVFPPGWGTLSDAGEQDYVFVENSLAGGHLVPKAVCQPIGVAPILSISGRFLPAPNSLSDDYQLTAIGSDDQTLSVPFDSSGNFNIVGDRGYWTLEIADHDGETVYSRTVYLNHGPIEISTIDLGRTELPASAGEVHTLGFDDLLISDSLFEIPSGYGSLNWRNWIAVHNRFYSGPGYVNLTVSSEYVAYNSSGVPALVWSEEPFDFLGTYIGVAWPRGEEEFVTIRAWRGSRVEYTDILHLTDNGPIYFDADYRQITKLEFSSGNYERIVLDDFQYSAGSGQ
jgi:hypothetical protein